MRDGTGSGRMVLVAVLLAAGCGHEQRFGPTEQGAAPAHEHGSAHVEGEHEGAHAEGAHEAAAGPQPTRVLDDGARLFGAELTDGRSPTQLAEITAHPEQYAGQVIQTSGTIERVCQRMGCWMELRAENVPAVRVPMAGHSFFLPRDVAGRAATIEGRVELQPLSEEARRHLESEGALATAASLAIEATSVVVR